MFVHHVAFAETLAAELAVVGVRIREVDVFDVLIGSAPVLEGLGAKATAEAQASASCRVTAFHVLRETGLRALYEEEKTKWRNFRREKSNNQ
jgi:hypothetical protein